MTASERREQRKLKEAERQRERERIKAGLLSVLDSEEATPAEKLEARQMLKRDFYI